MSAVSSQQTPTRGYTATKPQLQTRLRRIEGQVRGLHKMVEEDRYCADVMMQISSVHEALRAVGRELMRNHLKHCATSAIRSTRIAPERPAVRSSTIECCPVACSGAMYCGVPSSMLSCVLTVSEPRIFEMPKSSTFAISTTRPWSSVGTRKMFPGFKSR